jgi:hypothetical protein
VKIAHCANLTESGFIVSGEDEEGKEELVACLEIRGAAVSPTPAFPGYYLIFGKEKEAKELERHPLIFLSEANERLGSTLLERLRQDTRKLLAHTIYVDWKDERFSDSVDEKMKDLGVNVHPSLPNPLTEDIEQGVMRIQEWASRGLLHIPKTSILTEQLGKITPENFDDESFYAVKAFHWIVTWFEEYSPPDLIRQFSEKRREAERISARVMLNTVSRLAMDEFRQVVETLNEDEMDFDDELGFPVS